MTDLMESAPIAAWTNNRKKALCGPYSSLTFDQLSKYTLKIANVLKSASISIMALNFPFGAAQILSLCAAIDSQMVFVPIDDTQSIDRNIFVIQDSSCEGMLCLRDANLMEYLKSNKENLKIVDIELHDIILVTWSNASPTPSILKEKDAMYVLYTSGSTGKPKGVVGSRSATSSRIQWMWKALPFESGEAVLRSTKLTFVDSLWEILGSLWSCQTLILLSSDSHTPPLIEWLDSTQSNLLEEMQVSRMTLVPSLLQLLVNTIVAPSTLKFILVSGEPFHLGLLECAMKWAPQTTFINLYGSTEVSGDATYFICKPGAKLQIKHEVPIGHAIDNVKTKLVEDEKTSAAELWISGSTLSLGYLNRPDEDHKKFIINDGDRWFKTGDLCRLVGNFLYFEGRIDSMVKISGVGVHLNSIENSFRHWFHCEFPQLKSKWIIGSIAVGSSFGDEQLDKVILYLGIHGGKQLFPLEKIDEALEYVYKINLRVWIIIICLDWEEFPLTSSGKVDREQLRSLYFNQLNADGFDDTFLSTIQKYLPLDSKLDLSNTTLLDLGCNSLAATMIIHAIHDQWGVTLKLQDLFLKSISQLQLEVHAKRKSQNSKSSVRNKRQKLLSSAHKLGELLRLEWTISMEKCIDATPLVVNINSATYVFIGSHDHQVICVNASASPPTIVWRTNLPDRIESSCCSFKNCIFVGCYDGYIYCLHELTGEVIWKYRTNDQVKCSPCAINEHQVIVCGSHDHHIYGLGAFTGECIFAVEFEGSIFGSPVYEPSQELLFCGSTAGELSAFSWKSLTDSKLPTWTKKMAAPIFSSLVLSDNLLFVACADGNLHCFGLDGQLIWKIPTSKPIFSTPCIVSPHVIVFGSHDGILRAANIQTGQVVASADLKCAIFSSPAVMSNEDGTDAVCFVATTNGTLFAWNLKDSSYQKSLVLEGDVFSSPMVHKKFVYIGTRANKLVCINAGE